MLLRLILHKRKQTSTSDTVDNIHDKRRSFNRRFDPTYNVAYSVLQWNINFWVTEVLGPYSGVHQVIVGVELATFWFLAQYFNY